ncbi:MAG: alanine dehydrogenase [Gammaproteobacteria bacterium]
MRIGVPREIKIQEGRVALIPNAAAELVKNGHEVIVEKNAGILSGYSDDQYLTAGIKVCSTADELFEQAELIVKVKEPLPEEVDKLRPDHLLFSYLHLAAEPQLLSALCSVGLTAIAFETVADSSGRLPLLTPMSDIAGRLSVQIGSNLLYHHHQGRGVLLGGLPAAERGKVVILGAGVAGSNAARIAAGLGAEVVVFDKNRDKLQEMRTIGDNVTSLYAFSDNISDYVQQADLVVGAVLIPGAKAPHIVSADLVKAMNPGSVLVDISVDQGGCIETIHATNYDDPTYIVDEVIHFGVTNMPGAVPRTASQALSAALLPYIQKLTDKNWHNDVYLNSAINVANGEIIYPTLQKE